jgi:hypothetical protein
MNKERTPITHPDRLKWFRNVNLLGAGAFILAGGYFPAYQGWLYLGAATNIAEAGGAEAIRQRKIKKQQK